MRIISLGILSFFAVAWAFAQERQVITVDVDLVSLDVVVTDGSGKAVLNLTRDDFEIYEDGQRQQLGSFTSVDTPYNVLMLFDCSGSTEPSRPFLIDAVNRFTASLRKQDNFAMAQFGQGYKRLLSWTELTGKPTDVKMDTNDNSCGGTDFYGAIERATAEFKGQQGRKGVVVLSDGEDQKIPFGENARLRDAANDTPFQRLLKTVRSADVVFYFVAVDTDLNPTLANPLRGYDPTEIYNMQQVRARMELLAAASGGRVSFPKSPRDLVPLYEQIGSELGTSYGLGYTPSNSAKDDKVRKIEVRVRDKSLRVRQSRDSYQATR